MKNVNRDAGYTQNTQNSRVLVADTDIIVNEVLYMFLNGGKKIMTCFQEVESSLVC